MLNRTTSSTMSDTRRKLVDAGVKLMRAHGYNATTVDAICADAGVTKGGFFHYFKSKDDIAHAAITHFFKEKSESYEAAPFRKLADPLDRVFGRLDYVQENSGGKERLTKGCLIGVLSQELAFTNPEIREMCRDFFTKVGADFAHDLAEAKALHAPDATFDPKGLAQMYLAIVQGSLILAKLDGSNEILGANFEMFRGQLKSLFGVAGSKATSTPSNNARN